MKPAERLDRIRYVVAHWDEEPFDEAQALEMGIADAAANALVDALMDHESMPEALADAPLTPGEEELRAVHTMEAEVNVGGFQQFFDNCGHEEVRLAAKGCARIGAAHFDEVVRAALALVPAVPEDDWPEDVLSALNDVDERFYDGYREVEELLKLRLAHVAAHPDEFRGVRG